MKLNIDLNERKLSIDNGGEQLELDLYTKEAFTYLSDVWLKCGWMNKYAYSFTWFGRPIIQLPEDMIRIQELIYRVQPDVIIETGIAHGGTLIYYSSLCKAMGKGRVIGIDIEIRPHNRQKIENHELFDYITLIEGNSVDSAIVQQVRSLVKDGERVLVILDSNHSKQHVLQELQLYSPLVSADSYIVATDGIMEQLAGAPDIKQDWSWDNPKAAAEQFVQNDPRFVLEEPLFPFNEGNITERITYWPSAYIKRII
ncbi:cephalosporin hydroxylase family protein [Paenibacillus larvae subsp. larvae]|uniref:Cephalosporin hydroxylase family protein n=1 Tax=Paenibacillus larvae subsp. larvae TaxID=147375 RepID=A0A2L1UJV3_9BACL|nr:CmcI family methyltransferase [Paenibacillus larvae]AQT84939.1 hydroxylase [Paenibacillus larvae subsp. pulvifaciens]AQZ46940.1 hydroxylase [Paenibacillus larvae subsp. pulvifaciens]AVF28713.1 cephalosporin hydroxylase family protein [Paenibacillus larvae subsp. larvae]AVF33219.1 cephalosporin hydroxylase family protein [Paenibacillus larvae subsp. larvae]MBH0343025.1 hydroxylase [Paenibacillus larvae]